MVTTGGRDDEMPVGVGRVEQTFLNVGFGDALDGVAHFLGDQLRGVGVDHIGDLVHLAGLHQQANDVDGPLRHAVGEFLNGDRLRQDDLAGDLFLGFGDAALQALVAANIGRMRTHALLVAAGGGRGDGETAPVLHSAARRRRTRRNRAPARRWRGAAARGRMRVRFGAPARFPRRRGVRRARREPAPPRAHGAGWSFAGEPAARLFLGFALEIRFARETRLFFVLAGVGGGALVALAGFALGAGLGLDLGAAAVFLLAPRASTARGRGLRARRR